VKAVAMCTCAKKRVMDDQDIRKSKYQITEHVDGVCKYCDHYVHWRPSNKILQTIEEFTRCESRCERYITEGSDLTRDERYVYGYTFYK
jgi:hypothetical protein